MSAFGDDSCITKEELEELKKKLKSQDLSTTINTIKDILKQQDLVELNIGVTGETGSGKSSFVNAFRGLGDEDEGSAKIGVTETTMKPEAYDHPKCKTVKLWDLPGIGTNKFKAEKYLELVEFERYDFFIIIASGRFKECHTQLVKEIMRMGKTFYFVRSSIDLNITAERRMKNFDLKQTLDRIREDCENGLKEIGVEDPVVFLISSWEFGQYDFSLLQKRMEEELPEHKRRVLMLALPNITLEINENKKTALRKNIKYIALLSSCVAAIPIPGLSLAVDLVLIASEIQNYCDAFGLDKKSLQQLCEKFGKSMETVEELIESLWYKGTCTDFLVSALRKSSFLVTEEAVESFFRFVPILGTVAAGGLSYLTVSMMLNKALDDIAGDAQKVIMALLHEEKR